MADRMRLARPPRILLVSDQDGRLRDLETLLSSHGYSVFRVFAAGPALERARAVRPDVIILDERLADRPTLELSRALRDDALLSLSTPILLLTPRPPTPHDHLAALRAGVWELLRQPLNPPDLLLKLDGYVLSAVEAERAPQASLVDELTGLYTAQGLTRRARELIFQAAHHNAAAACVVLALEATAEPVGGDAGPVSAEQVRRVGQLLKTTGRRADALGRVGQTEFAVVAPGTDAGGAVKLAERLRRSTLQGAPGGAGAAGLELRAGYEAVGNVRYTPVEPTRLLARAARALLLAKAEGAWIHGSSE